MFQLKDNAVSYLILVIICIMLAYLLGVTITRVVDRRLKNLEIKLPKQNIVVKYEGFKNEGFQGNYSKHKTKEMSEKLMQQQPIPQITAEPKKQENFTNLGTYDEVDDFYVAEPYWNEKSQENFFEGIVYITSFDHHIYAIDLTDGNLIWKFKSDGAIVSRPQIIGDDLFFGTFGTTFYALNRKTGDEKWRFEDSSGWFWADSVIFNDMVLAPSLDGILYALDRNSGQIQWTLPVQSPIVSRPVIIGQKFALATTDGRVIVSDLKTGIEVGSCDLGKEIRSPLVSFDEYLIVTPEDGSLRLISVGSSGDLDEIWIYSLEEDFLSPGDKLWERAC